jgi:hypothetical protein
MVDPITGIKPNKQETVIIEQKPRTQQPLAFIDIFAPYLARDIHKKAQHKKDLLVHKLRQFGPWY